MWYSLGMKMTSEELEQYIANIPSAEWLAEHGYSGAQAYAYAITSDAHKDAYGIRCRWMAYAPIEELAQMSFDCVQEMRRAQREEEERELAMQHEMQASEEAFRAAYQAALNPAPFGTEVAGVWPK